jgi:hypothetical protein
MSLLSPPVRFCPSVVIAAQRLVAQRAEPDLSGEPVIWCAPEEEAVAA